MEVASKRHENKQADTQIISRRNYFPVNRRDSVLLMISSCFFSIAGVYAAFSYLYLHSIVSIITTFVSVNYWRYAVNGARRTADLIISKVSFLIYFISGCIFVRDWFHLIVSISLCVGIIVLYKLSCHYWDQDSPSWVHFHFTFHICVAFQQYLIVYNIVEYISSQT